MFADYEFYTDIYHGTSIPKADFSKNERMAAAFIDALTFGRASRLTDVPEEVKLASCAGAEVFYKYTKALDAQPIGVKSESVDGYSVSFTDTTELHRQRERAVTDAISLYLPRSHPLRYRGASL